MNKLTWTEELQCVALTIAAVGVMVLTFPIGPLVILAVLLFRK